MDWKYLVYCKMNLTSASNIKVTTQILDKMNFRINLQNTQLI